MTCSTCPYRVGNAIQTYCIASGRAVPLLVVTECPTGGARMGGTMDRVYDALERCGPMTAREISATVFGDDDEKSMCNIWRGITGLRKYGMVVEVGKVMRGVEVSVFYIAGREVPPIPEHSRILSSAKQSIMDLLGERGPMTTAQICDALCAQNPRLSRSTISNHVCKLRKLGEIVEVDRLPTRGSAQSIWFIAGREVPPMPSGSLLCGNQRRVYDILTEGGAMTVSEIAREMYGDDLDSHKNLVRQAVYRLMNSGHVERIEGVRASRYMAVTA